MSLTFFVIEPIIADVNFRLFHFFQMKVKVVK